MRMRGPGRVRRTMVWGVVNFCVNMTAGPADRSIAFTALALLYWSHLVTATTTSGFRHKRIWQELLVFTDCTTL